jgi:hypothetical protein
MHFQNCPRCGLSIRVRAAHPAPMNCPRCIARQRLAVPMYSTPHRARVLATRRILGDSPENASDRPRSASPAHGADTAA